MSYDEIVSVLGYACDNEEAVRITTADLTEVMGIPTTVDASEEGNEVFLKPAGDDETEIALSLAGITHVELLG
jgi:hypothetical protein